VKNVKKNDNSTGTTTEYAQQQQQGYMPPWGMGPMGYFMQGGGMNYDPNQMCDVSNKSNVRVNKWQTKMVRILTKLSYFEEDESKKKRILDLINDLLNDCSEDKVYFKQALIEIAWSFGKEIEEEIEKI